MNRNKTIDIDIPSYSIDTPIKWIIDYLKDTFINIAITYDDEDFLGRIVFNIYKLGNYRVNFHITITKEMLSNTAYLEHAKHQVKSDIFMLWQKEILKEVQADE